MRTACGLKFWQILKFKSTHIKTSKWNLKFVKSQNEPRI
ncbi:hypothetical protein UNSW2_471 [Campylobacter concisus UNSW2]|uniref:Uncharacterized protein n=1 Tax=Campylobacter concisus UNSW2 TaxID=1242965 RepID=U2H1T4_9BACT|nr:hypothetical protein UNSW2_471 [Campylobacter concisus UNSW2]